MCTFGFAVLYADCQAPNSGKSRVLPVSVIVLPEVGALWPDGGDVVLEVQAAASTVSGTRTATAAIKRIRLVTGDYSLCRACRGHALRDSRADCARLSEVA